MELFDEALRCEGVDGLIIGTRPDCMPPDLLHELTLLSAERFVMVEYGAESAHDRTLQAINRCHTWADTVDAVIRTHDARLPVGLHLIMGLPGEARPDMLATVDAVNALPVDIVKIHQLQLIRGTVMALQAERGEAVPTLWSIDEYVDLCREITVRLRRDIAIERFVSQSPDSLLIAPRWGVKNYQFTAMLRKALGETTH